MCALPFGSGAKLRVRRIGVVGWKVFGWVVGVEGTMVVTDTFSRQTGNVITHKCTETIIYNMQQHFHYK